MKTAFHFGLSFICILLMMFGLTGCQLFDRLWPFGNAAEIENLLPDEEDLAKLEEEAQDLADLFREGEDTGTVPFKGDFMLNYLYDQTVDAFVVHASFTEKIEFEYPGGGDYTKATYYFDTSFSGTQEEEIAALYEGNQKLQALPVPPLSPHLFSRQFTISLHRTLRSPSVKWIKPLKLERCIKSQSRTFMCRKNMESPCFVLGADVARGKLRRL